MKLFPLAVCLLLAAGPSALGSRPALAQPASSATRSERFEAARSRAAERAARLRLRLDREILYALTFSDRPGWTEIAHDRVDVTRLTATPRPPFWQGTARVRHGVHLWDGRLEMFDRGDLCALLDPACFRLVESGETTARGRPALRLVFRRVGDAGDRVEITVDPDSFDPWLVERTLEAPLTTSAARLVTYHLRLSLAPISGLWLVAQGEESYRYEEAEGTREVDSRWLSLTWEGSGISGP